MSCLRLSQTWPYVAKFKFFPYPVGLGPIHKGPHVSWHKIGILQQFFFSLQHELKRTCDMLQLLVAFLASANHKKSQKFRICGDTPGFLEISNLSVRYRSLSCSKHLSLVIWELFLTQSNTNLHSLHCHCNLMLSYDRLHACLPACLTP